MQNKIRGYNNNSGLLYTVRGNGLNQYNQKDIQYPIWNAPQAKYINKRNEEELLETMRDGEEDFNKDGNRKIENIPNLDLANGDFKNKGNVENQEDNLSVEKKYKKLIITKEAKQLARRNTGKLPIDEDKKKKENNTLNKFKSFISSLENKNKKFDNEYNDPRSRLPE